MKSYRGIAYHGSSIAFEKFDFAKSRDLSSPYGSGVGYFTDSREVASLYAKNMAKKRGTPIIYTVDLSIKKLFDTTEYFTGKELTNVLPNNLDKFARDCGLIENESDRDRVLSELKNGNMSLSGVSVFRGLSSEMRYSDEAKRFLMSKGYDGLRYVGVLPSTSAERSVYLVYNIRDINILSAEMLAFKNLSS